MLQLVITVPQQQNVQTSSNIVNHHILIVPYSRLMELNVQMMVRVNVLI